jgi:tRNA (adenine57-N1/adenine58-N1)-methyltransferase
MKNGELVLLLSKEKSYLTEVGKGKLSLQEGMIDLKNLLKKSFGDEIKTHIGKKFIMTKPNLNDILKKKMKRLPQIIMPKDAALILAYTTIGSGNTVVDSGCGSGFLAIFLANYVKPGKVVTYEINKQFAKIAKENIENSQLRNVRLKIKDVRKGINEKNIDLVTLDMQYCEKVVKHAYKSLKPGGWLVVYSPYIEQVKKVVKEIEKNNFTQIKTVENIVREWQVRRHTLPMRSGITHTGFLTFARKLG